MPNETLGASFSIDVTALKAGLAQANRLIRESESEFKAAAAGMDDWTESQEGLEARMKHLNATADLQNKKVDALQAEYDRLISDGLDPTSAAAVKLRTDINKEKEALAKTEKELKEQTKALEELAEAADDAGDAVDDTGDAADDAGDNFTVAKGAIATFIGNGLTALVGAAKNAISSMLGLAESTREYRTIMASLENSSARAGYTVEETAATFDQLNGVLGDTQATATTTANLQAIGLEQSKLQNLTNGVIGAWAKYGDSIPIDGLGEAINHTAQLGEVQGTLADVIEWGGGTVEDFNAKLAECSTETERADLIAKMLADQGLTQAGEAWQENNKNIVDANKAQAEYEKNTAALGEKIEPITTTVREGFNKILGKVLELVNGVDLEAYGEKISGAFDTFINDIMPKIVDGLNWIIDNKDGIIAGIVGIGAAFAAFKVVSLIQGVVSALNGMTLAQYALNLAMSLNPIGLVVAAVAGLVAAFVVLWNKCDAFKQFWLDLWEKIKGAFSVIVDWIKENWQTMLLALVNPLGAIFKYCYEHFEGFRNFVDNIVTNVKKFFSDMWTGFTNGAKNAWQSVKDTFSKVGSFFGDVFSKAWRKVKDIFSTGGKIFDGIKEGIATAFKNIVNSIIRGINTVVSIPFNAINKVLDKIRNVSVAGVSPFKNLIGEIAVPEIPQLATGGVVKKATTAVIGEDGAEAVVPLERNKEWIREVAKEMTAQQKQSVVVNQTNHYSQAHSRYELYKTKQQTEAAVRLAMGAT